MRRFYTVITIFAASILSFTLLAQSRIMTVHTKDNQVIERYVTDVDSITFRTGTLTPVGPPYTPTFRWTNINNVNYPNGSGAWDDFQVCKGTLYATNTLYGILKYEDGNWVPAPNMPGDVSPIIREYNNKIYILAGNLYVEKDDGSGYEAIFYAYDLNGALGGTANAFFAGAGTYGTGIFKFNGQTLEQVYNNGTWYSLDVAGENVFFGAGATHVDGNYGVVYWSNLENKICETNLNNGIYNLASYKDIIFATGSDNSAVEGTYRFNGTSFDKILDKHGVLKATGGALYFLYGSVAYKYDDATASFEEFRSNVVGNNYTQIEEHDGFLYLFGSTYVEALYVESDTWLQVEIDAIDAGVHVAKSTEFGLFISNMYHSYSGIRKMIPVYD